MDEQQIFEAASEIPDLGQRQLFLDQACGANVDLRGRVEALLESDAGHPEFLKLPTLGWTEFNSLIKSAPTLEMPIATDPIDNTKHDENETDGSDLKPNLNFLQPTVKPGSIGRLGHYELLEVLGQGSYGIVFKAFDEKLHRFVAIKAMDPQLAATSSPRKRFLREARSAAAIKHENVVQVHSVEEQPIPYLVMEFIEGPTLQQKLSDAGPLEVAEILHLGRQMASGLAAAHARGLIHRDIKPANILLEQGAEQKVKITDFGLARTADDASMTQTGLISGTPMYMSPEQALGLSLDHRSDLFSLGSVLYQMTSGRPPFRAPTTLAVLKRVTDETPRSIRDIIADVPVWLDTLIHRLLAKEPADRFQSAHEIAALFAKCQAELQTTGDISCAAATTSSLSTATNIAVGAPPLAKAFTIPATEPSAVPLDRRWLVIPGCIAAIALLTFIIVNNSTSSKQAGSNRAIITRLQPTDATTGSVMPTGAGKSIWHDWPADAPQPAIVPFTAVEAKQHQQAWAGYLGVQVEYTNSLGMKFQLIPPGEFMMGSTQDEFNEAIRTAPENEDYWRIRIQSESPQHRVILTQPFFIGVKEVTQLQYQAVAGSNPSTCAADGASNERVTGLDTSKFPVENLTWNDAIAYCNKLSECEKVKPFVVSEGPSMSREGTGYRLPTEAEWEFACRAGTTTKFWNGNTDDDLMRSGWFRTTQIERSRNVGELASNPFGLFDVHGNVAEWVHDAWNPTYYAQFADQPAIDPIGPTVPGDYRVTRGGVWHFRAPFCRSASRYSVPVNYNDPSTGFRTAISVDGVVQAVAQRASSLSAGD